MPRIGWFGSAQRRVTAFSTAETFNSARNLLTHCHPTRHATPVHTCTHQHKNQIKNFNSLIRFFIHFRYRLTWIRTFFNDRQTEEMKHKEEGKKRRKKYKSAQVVDQ